MRRIDLASWPRRAHFELFAGFGQPHFGVCAPVEVAALRTALQARELPFSLGLSYVLTRAANAITPFRWRLRANEGGSEVVEHDALDASVTVDLPGSDLFGFCLLPYTPDFGTFLSGARAAILQAQTNPSLDDAPGRDDVLYLSSLPWLAFTGLTHAMPDDRIDSIPRITSGKFTAQASGLSMPLSVQAHHALMDGRHLGLYFQAVQELCDSPESWLS